MKFATQEACFRAHPDLRKNKQCKRPQLEDDDKTGYIYALEEAKELVLTQ
jgi:hypothetical protein